MGAGKDSDSYVSVIIKYLMFFFNLIFWLIGGAFIAIGVWAFIEKNQFEYKSSESDKPSDNGSQIEIYDLVFDLTIVMIILGVIIFIVSFTGCVGAFRENITLLKIFSYILGALFIIEIVLAVLAFVFSSEVKAKVVEILQYEGLGRYRDDDDFRNLVDWIQKTFSCCGVGIKGFKDWSYNPYFNCTAENPSTERCAVPYSCCVNPNNIQETLINTMCGYNTQGLSYVKARETIYTSGCVEAMLDIAEANLYIIGGVAIGLAVPQLLGIALACLLYKDIELEAAMNTVPYQVEPTRF